MPSPPRRRSFLALLLACLVSSSFPLFFDAASAVAPTCTPLPPSNASCPPFAAAAPYPFGFSPGCAHPSFQVHCASPHSTISINGLSFAVISYRPNSTSLLLSPHPLPNRTICSAAAGSNRFTSVPDRAIDFSGSPFRASDASCSRLSLLRPCRPWTTTTLPNCTHCPWECELAKSPTQLFHGCGRPSRSSSPRSDQACQEDLLDHLDRLLKLGIQVEWTEQDAHFSNCRACEAKSGVCGFKPSDPGKQFLCFRSHSRLSPPPPPPVIHGHDYRLFTARGDLLLFISTVSALAAVVAIVAAVVHRSTPITTEKEEDPATLFLHRSSSLLLPPVFTYDELNSSTDAFDPKRKIGDGGFGSVYLGRLNDGRVVAVKLLHRHRDGGSFLAAKSFYNEILILSSVDHPNLVRLHGYCSDPRGLLLVYDYVPNGTLADHLHRSGKCSLTWQVRVDVALQTAMAMEYLHFKVAPAVVHGDIKSSNIFVEEDMSIKVGDFGLSRFLFEKSSSSQEEQSVCTGPQGTPGYLDPEYHRSSQLTEKSDVYSFGVVLLELVTGKEAVDRREVTLADMAVARIQMGLLRQVVDPALAVNGDAMDSHDGGGGVAAVAELAFRCVAADKDDRPDAREVVAELRRIRSASVGVEAADGGPRDVLGRIPGIDGGATEFESSTSTASHIRKYEIGSKNHIDLRSR